MCEVIMKRNAWIRIISLLLAMSLAGCGGKTGSDTTSVETSESVQTENSSEEKTYITAEMLEDDYLSENNDDEQTDPEETNLDDSDTEQEDDEEEDSLTEDSPYGSSETEQEIVEDILPDDQKSLPSEDKLSADEALEYGLIDKIL